MEGVASERWMEVDHLELDIKKGREIQAKALSDIEKHRKVVDDIQSSFSSLSEDEKTQARKAVKEAKELWARDDATYKKTVADLVSLELKKQALMERLKREDQEMEREKHDNEELIRRLQEQLKTDGDGGASDAETLVQLIKTIANVTKGPVATSSPGGAPRTRSLANLPILAKPGGFIEHLTKLETYFRINEVVREADKKDILMLSLSAEVSSRAQGIDASAEPFLSQSWREYTETVRGRMIPKASAAILRTQLKQLCSIQQ